jgi:hypothetical protein
MKLLPLLGYLICMASLESCLRRPTDNGLKSLTENTRRRLATSEEQKLIVRFDKCTGFWVENQQNFPLVMTAQHCLNFEAENWCKKGSVEWGDKSEKLRCLKILAGGDSNVDAVLLEFDKRPDTARGIKLASFEAENGTPLRMIGFPADISETNHAVVSENCWVQSRQATNPFQESDSISNYFRRGMQDRVFHHNCALYGGNSGGPILIEGTDIAVGMPYSFESNSVMRPFNDVFATGAHISDFVRRFGQVLGQRVISIVNSQSEPMGAALEYLSVGNYRVERLDCSVHLIPLYHAADFLSHVKIQTNCDRLDPKLHYLASCRGERCVADEFVIENLQQKQMMIRFQGGTRQEAKRVQNGASAMNE